MSEYELFFKWVYSDHENEDISQVKFSEKKILATSPPMSDGQFFRLIDKIRWYSNWGVITE